MSCKDHVVVEEEAECGAQGEADDVGGDVVCQRRGVPEDVVGEQEAELGDADAAGVSEEEEDGFARGVCLGAAAVGPQAVGDPRVERGGRGCDELRGVGVAGEHAERPVLEQVEQSGVDDVRGGANHAELDEFAHPGEESLGEAQGRGWDRFLVHLSARAGLSEGRGRGGLLVHLSAGASLSKRGGGVRERRGFTDGGRGGERGGSARGSLFVVHSPSLARTPLCFYHQP